MRKILATLAAALLLAVLVAVPATAITDGAPDGDAHPYVGLMVADDADGNPLWSCSGALISPRLFLTAGHCAEAPAVHVEIWFASGPIPLAAGFPAPGPGICAGITGYPCTGDIGGTPTTHPDYEPERFYYRDLGVVVLDAPRIESAYAALPEVEQLDALKMKRGKQDLTFTAVGYGLQKAFPPAAQWKEVNVRLRMVAHPKLIQINVPGTTGDFSMILSNNAKTGGTCFGDSGGPNLVGTSNVIGGVTSSGGQTCAGTGGVFRVDRAWSLDWINALLSAHP